MHPRQSLLETPHLWATRTAPRAVRPHWWSALLPKPRPDSWWQLRTFHTGGKSEHHKNVCVIEYFLWTLVAGEYHDLTSFATCQDSIMTDQMTGFPVVNQVYARCESRGYLVQLLMVKRDLALVCGLIIQELFPQSSLCDWRSLKESRLCLMAAHWQQLVFSSTALLSRLIKNSRTATDLQKRLPSYLRTDFQSWGALCISVYADIPKESPYS